MLKKNLKTVLSAHLLKVLNKLCFGMHLECCILAGTTYFLSIRIFAMPCISMVPGLRKFSSNTIISTLKSKFLLYCRNISYQEKDYTIFYKYISIESHYGTALKKSKINPGINRGFCFTVALVIVRSHN